MTNPLASAFGSGNGSCPVMVGRSTALDAIERRLAGVREGNGQVLTVSGEAGIGKSRLIAEAKLRAVDSGWVILEGCCFETDRTLPYAPILDLLRSLLTGRAPESRRTLLGPDLSRLSDLLVDITAIGSGGHPPATRDPGRSAEHEKRHLFNALCDALAQIASTHPILVIIEDLHWSDDVSLEFVLYCARQTAARPIALLLSYRDDEVHPELEHLLVGLDRQRRVLELRLPRLAVSDVETMLRAILELGRPVSARYVEAIHTLTDGNPFFIEEILRSLVPAGGSVADAALDSRPLDVLHVPRTVQDAVRRRSQQLSPPARQILTLAAVAGRRFQFPILMDLARCDAHELLALIREWVAARLVVEESSEQFAFRHALTQRAIYSALLARERRGLHAQIAAAMERLYPAELDLRLAELAHHTYEGGEWEKAFDYARRFGERAWAMHAPRAAAEQFGRALYAAQQLETIPDPTLYLTRGKAFETLGNFERAREDYESALSLARSGENDHAEWQALSDLGLLWAGREYARSGAYFREASEVAQSLDDAALRARSLNRLGNWLVNTGYVAEGIAAHDDALALFEARQDRNGTAETLDLLGMSTGIYGDVVRSVAYYGRAIALLQEPGDEAALSTSLASRVSFANPAHAETTASPLGTLEACLNDAAAALQLARQLDWLAGQAYAEFVACAAGAAFGEFNDTLVHGREALRIASEIGHQQWIAGARWALGLSYVAMTAAEPAIEHLEAGLPLARELGSVWWIGQITAYLAFAYLLAGTPDLAEALLREAMPRDREPRNSPERRLLWAWGELSLAQGDANAVLQIVARLYPSMPGDPTSQAVPALLKLQGEALAALARYSEAEAVLEAAARGAAERRDRPRLWQIQRSLAAVYERTGRTEQARSTLAAAGQLAAVLTATIGDVSLRQQILAALFGSSPVASVEKGRRANADAGGLTAREREVTALVAHGDSNRAIADALVIGERTVESHISNILLKLGFKSRTQIAAWAVERGLRTAP